MTRDLNINELRGFLQEGMRNGSEGVASFALLSRILLSQQERESRDGVSRQFVLDSYQPVWDAFESEATGGEVQALLVRAEALCDQEVMASDGLATWVDPTGRLTARDLEELRGKFKRVLAATELPAFNWEAQWLNNLVLTDREIAPNYPAREAVNDGWAFLVSESSRLASDQELTPGIAEYVGTLMGRAAVLGRQTAGLFHSVYQNRVVTHLGVEAAFALARMELEVVGRARAIVTPEVQAHRVKAYVAARMHDLTLAQDMTKVESEELTRLQGLVTMLDAIPGEPNVFPKSPVKPTWQPLRRWTLNAGAAARWLHASNKGPGLYRELSEAVHGGAVIEESWFANGEAFGVGLVRRCAEVLRSELVELNSAYLRYAVMAV